MAPITDRIIDALAKIDPNTGRHNGCVRIEVRHTSTPQHEAKPLFSVETGRTDNHEVRPEAKATGNTEDEALANLLQQVEAKVEEKRQRLREELSKLD